MNSGQRASKRYREKQRAKGNCLYCGKKANGKARCKDCTEKIRIARVERRQRLIDSLGKICNWCSSNGKDHLCDMGLHLDHINDDRTWDSTTNGPDTRIKLLEQEAARGEIQVLCFTCNSTYKRNGKSKEQRLYDLGITDVPF